MKIYTFFLRSLTFLALLSFQLGNAQENSRPYYHKIVFQPLSLAAHSVTKEDYERLSDFFPANENLLFKFTLGKPSAITGKVTTLLNYTFNEEILPNKRIEIPILPLYFSDKASCLRVTTILVELRPLWSGNEGGESFDFIFKGACEEIQSENGEVVVKLEGNILTKLYR